MNVNALKVPWNAAGENLHAQFTYNLISRSYKGDISIQPVHLKVHTNLPVDMVSRCHSRLRRTSSPFRARSSTLRNRTRYSPAPSRIFARLKARFKYHVVFRSTKPAGAATYVAPAGHRVGRGKCQLQRSAALIYSPAICTPDLFLSGRRICISPTFTRNLHFGLIPKKYSRRNPALGL